MSGHLVFGGGRIWYGVAVETSPVVSNCDRNLAVYAAPARDLNKLVGVP
jgi:hypothetical protein